MRLIDAVDAFILSMEAQGRSQRTISGYRERLSSFLARHHDSELDQLRPEDVEVWLVSLRHQKHRWSEHPTRPATNGGLSVATIATRLQTLKTLFRWCVQRGYMQQSPAAHLKRINYSHTIESDKVMRPEDLHAMLAVACRTSSRDFALLTFIADTGARVGEVASLRLRSLHLHEYEAVVQGKTGRRPVYFTSETRTALERWLEERPDCDHDYVFTGTFRNHTGRRLKPGGIYQVFKRLACMANVERYNPQSIRHLVGQCFVDRENLVLAQKKLGHKDITTTAAFYAHQDKERIKAATQRSSLLNRL